MALPPFSASDPKPELTRDRQLHDRAFLLGEVGRSDPNKRARDGKDAFKKVFDNAIEDGTEALGDSPEALPTQTAPDETVLNLRDAERQSKKGAEEEAERAAGGWRGPHPSMGLAMLPSQAQLAAPTIGETGEAEGQKRASQSEASGSDAAQNPVDRALIDGLRKAGLDRPLVGFHDGRVQEDKALLSVMDGWSEKEIPGGKVYHWQQLGGKSFQRIRLSEGSGLLESFSANTRQVIEKDRGDYRTTLTHEAD